jgi:hypothetical protein
MVNTDDHPLMMRVHKQGDETAEGIVMTPLATDLLFDDTSFTVVLGDGRRLKIPLRCFPRLVSEFLERTDHSQYRQIYRQKLALAGDRWRI